MNIIDYIEISFIKGIGKRTIKKLYESFGDVSLILQNPEIVLEDFGEAVYKKIKNRDKNLRERAKRELEKAEKLGIKIVTLKDEDYPSLLKEIPDPPAYLYYKGKLPDERVISIVGSRKFSSYGRSITEKFTKELVREDIGIVSGLASGIDSIAHKTCLENEGFTVAVLGGGIDKIFPYENRKLYYEIAEKGCLISEFPIGTKPSKFTFPIRNRIIAGLSYGTVVTEAGEKSGALITARYANEYGRFVFSVPTNINNPYGRGNNLLIKDGATPFLEIKDVFENIPYLKQKKIRHKEVEILPVEKEILNVLTEPSHIDLIVEKTGIPMDKLMTILFDMEIKGLISNDEGFYIRNI